MTAKKYLLLLSFCMTPSFFDQMTKLVSWLTFVLRLDLYCPVCKTLRLPF